MTWIPSLSRHWDENSDGQNDDGLPVSAPEIPIAYLVPVKIKMGEAMTRLVDIQEDGWDMLLH
jgi:hypothetical protein